MIKLPKTIKMVITDFDGIITDNCVYVSSSGEMTRKINFKDIMAFSLLRKNGYKIGIISGESNSAINILKEKFNIEEVHQGIRDKISVLKSIVSKYNLSEEEFIAHLSLYGVTLNRTKTEYSYLHPKKKKPIRGAKLGENYTKKEILNGINKNRYGGTSNSVIGNRETYGCVQGYDGQPTTSRSIGEIERELQRLNQESEYARQGLDGRSEIAKREQRVRDEKNDSISNGDGGRVSGSSEGGTSVQDGNKSNYKKRDYSFSK